MVGRIAWFAAIISAGVLFLTTTASAQDDEPTPAQSRRPLTLSERLQQFRQDLLGEPAPPSGPRRFTQQDDTPPTPRRTIIRPGQSNRQPTTRQRNVPIVRETPSNQLPAPPPDPPILTPPRMKAQSARRAKPGIGAETIDTDAPPIEVEEELDPAEPVITPPAPELPRSPHTARRARRGA